MKSLWVVLNFLVLFGIAIAQVPTNKPAASQNLLAIFDYDLKAPLDLKEAGVESVAGVAVHDVSFATDDGLRADAYITVPRGKGPFPAIVYMHWGQGNRTEFLPDAVSMADVGALSLLLEPAEPKAEKGHPQDPMAFYTEMVRDIRRAIDVLSSRKDVDPKRIVYVGHSLGATWGGVLAAAEPRFIGFVLMAGLPALSDFMQNSALDEVVRQREHTPKDVFNKQVAAFAPYDAVKWIARATPRSILFQWAAHDQYITKADADKYFAAAPQPKSQKTYFSGHALNGWDCFNDRRNWLVHELRLKSASH